MLRFLFGNKPDPAVDRLYQRAVVQARSPVFYQEFGIADTLDGRFEMVVLHVSALVDGLREPSGALSPSGQELFDAFLADMEQNIRSFGIGDTSLSKKMKKMGAAFYGRFDAYRRAKDDPAALSAAVARNVLDQPDRPASAPAQALADYLAALFIGAPKTLAEADAFAFPDPVAFAPVVEAAR